MPELPDTAALSPARPEVVSFVDTASSTSLRRSDFFCEFTSGTMLPARKLCSGSSSVTKWFCRIAADVLKILAAVTLRSTRARTVTGPPPSLMATKLPGLMVSPYFCRRPGSPDGRFSNAEGAPKLTSGECAAKSAIVCRFQSLAVPLVTVTVSVSEAGDGVRIDRSPGSFLYSSNSTASSIVAVDSGAKYNSRLPMYSGTKSME